MIAQTSAYTKIEEYQCEGNVQTREKKRKWSVKMRDTLDSYIDFISNSMKLVSIPSYEGTPMMIIC